MSSSLSSSNQKLPSSSCGGKGRSGRGSGDSNPRKSHRRLTCPQTRYLPLLFILGTSALFFHQQVNRLVSRTTADLKPPLNILGRKSEAKDDVTSTGGSDFLQEEVIVKAEGSEHEAAAAAQGLTGGRDTNVDLTHQTAGVNDSGDARSSVDREKEEIFECDRSNWRSDVCVMKGDVRVDARSDSVILYARDPATKRGEEKIQPYSRKWEANSMESVHEMKLISADYASGLKGRGKGRHSVRKRQGGKGGEGGNASEDVAEQGDEESGRTEVEGTGLGEAEDGVRERGGELSAFERGGGGGADGRRRRRLAGAGEGEVAGRRVLSEHGGKEEFERMLSLPTKDPERRSVYLRKLGAHVTQMTLLDFKNKSSEGGKEFLMGQLEERVTYEESAWGWGDAPLLRCDVRHTTPALLFSTSGFTGNLYHDFNDGLIPVYITTAHLRGAVVLVIDQPWRWWFQKYEFVIRQLSKYPPILLGRDPFTHCFTHLTVGLQIHDELAVDPTRMAGRQGIRDFQHEILHQGWKEWPFRTEPPEGKLFGCLPLLTFLSRGDHTRAVENQEAVLRMARGLGFLTRVVVPTRTTNLQDMWHYLQQSDVMMGVHGAAMTHFLFLKPGAGYIQIVPLGCEWAADSYYGTPAVKLGLQYLEYKINVSESSLSRDYGAEDVVLTNPQRVQQEKGWFFSKEIYLERQNVTLDLNRVREVLIGTKEKLGQWPAYAKRMEKMSKLKRCQKRLRKGGSSDGIEVDSI